MPISEYRKLFNVGCLFMQLTSGVPSDQAKFEYVIIFWVPLAVYNLDLGSALILDFYFLEYVLSLSARFEVVW